MKVEMAQGKMEQNVKALILGKTEEDIISFEIMSSSVCKGKDPKGTDAYEGGKENTE